ncbi:DinB family protein [Candidatus Hodarchaeum mangrovi]
MQELIHTLKERRLGILYLLKMVPMEIWDWEPNKNMRNTADLANHLACSPLTICELLQGNLKDENDLISLEKNNMPLNAPGLVKSYENGLKRLIEFCNTHLEDAKEKSVQFFYQNKPSTIYKEVLEEIGHEWFHLGQLYVYLKQNGINLEMGHYYGYKDPDPTIPPTK